MKRIRIILLTALASGTLKMNAQTMPLTFKSAAEKTALLELYTSEGCSSCPPAEKWLSHLRESPGLWKEFVPVAFHVDYWDYLGWRDPWSSAEFSDRQRDYAAAWHSSNIYTPEFVRDGQEWRNWSGQNEVPKSATASPGILTVTSTNAIHWQTVFAPVKSSVKNYELHVAMIAGRLDSEVKAGENRGRKLTHDFIVLHLAGTPLFQTNSTVQGHFTLPQNSHANALAVWVTEANHLEPVQATGGWLKP